MPHLLIHFYPIISIDCYGKLLCGNTIFMVSNYAARRDTRHFKLQKMIAMYRMYCGGVIVFLLFFIFSFTGKAWTAGGYFLFWFGLNPALQTIHIKVFLFCFIILCTIKSLLDQIVSGLIIGARLKFSNARKDV